MIAELRNSEEDPGALTYMQPTVLAAHEQRAHYARRDLPCSRWLLYDSSPFCEPCMNRHAIEMKEELEDDV